MNNEFNNNAEIIKLLRKFFNDDDDKVDQWLVTDNPNLGGSTPLRLILNGRSDKVLSFIKNAIDENIR